MKLSLLLARVLSAILALVLLAVYPVDALAESPPPARLCFAGAADYAYADDRLWIHIRQVEPWDADLTYFVCDIQTTDPAALRTALAGDKVGSPREPTSDIAARHGARLAVNGDFYDSHAAGIIIRNGEVIRKKKDQ